MSRIFRRPMFRKGGNVGEGIMTGIVDREMHNESNPNGVGAQNAPVDFEQQYIDKITAAGAGNQGMDPLTAYLLAAGPAISSGTSFSDAVGKLADPNKQLIELMNKRAESQRNLKVGAAQFGLEQSSKERLLDKEIQARLDLESMKEKSNPLYDMQLGEEVQTYSGQPQVAQRAAKFKVTDSDELYKKVGSRAGGVLTFDISDPEQVKANKSFFKKMDGKFVYDPYADNYKKISFKKGVIGQPTTYMDIQSINLNDATTDPGAPVLSEFAKETEAGILEARKQKEIQDKIKRKKSITESVGRLKGQPNIGDI